MEYRNTKHKPWPSGIISLYMAIAVVLVSVMTACSSEIDQPVTNDDTRGGRLWLTLVVPQLSRADEIYEPGLDNENAIGNLTIFFFNNAAQGVNSPAATPFFKTIYVDNGFQNTDKGVLVDVPLTDYNYTSGDRIAVVVNMGDLSTMTSLGELQSYIPTATWQTDAQTHLSVNFTMASADNNDGVIIPVDDAAGSDNAQSVDKYYKAAVSVERTAARIDLSYDAAQAKESYIEYQSTGDDGAVNGHVRLYGLSPVNAMQQPSYALKRISDGLSDDYSCFEQWHYTGTLQQTDNRPAQYVIEPHTPVKTTGTPVPAEWYGVTSADVMSQGLWNEELNIATMLSRGQIVTDASGRRAAIVAYTNENTQHYTAHSSQWLTGIMLRAVFIPAVVYTDGNAAIPATDYKPEQTFWCYRCNDSNNPEGKETSLYFTTYDAAKAYADARPSGGAEITEYPSGRCFYHAWIRHTVEERATAVVFPMEYGIVRNHIYRLSFSFHRAGSPDADIDDPQGVEAVIYVRAWNVFVHDQIII